MHFFVLSGYVIGLTNRRAHFSADEVSALSRFRRYGFACAAVVLALPGCRPDSDRGNYFFLQNEAPG